MQPLISIQNERCDALRSGVPCLTSVSPRSKRPERKVKRGPSATPCSRWTSRNRNVDKQSTAAAQEGAICNHSVPDGIKADCARKARVFWSEIGRVDRRPAKLSSDYRRKR